MNKTLVGIILFCLVVGICPLESSIALRAAAFFPASKRFREIYGDIGADYQLEASCQLMSCLDLWVNFDWFSKSGKSEGERDSTRISIANASIGVRAIYRFCGGFIYLGIGDNFSGVWIKNNSNFTSNKHTSKQGMGGVVKSGFGYHFQGCAFSGLFVDYLYQPFHFNRHVNVGGFKVGGELGISF